MQRWADPSVSGQVRVPWQSCTCVFVTGTLDCVVFMIRPLMHDESCLFIMAKEKYFDFVFILVFIHSVPACSVCLLACLPLASYCTERAL